MSDIFSTEPTSISQNTTVVVKRSLSSYPATDSWVLSYNFRGPNFTLDVNAAASGADHLLTLTAAQTALFPSGENIIRWSATVTKAGERNRIAQGTMTVLADLSLVTSADDIRSHAKKVLDAIEATIEGRASKDQMAITLAGKTLARTPIPDLISLHKRYKSIYSKELEAERIKQGLGSSKNIGLRFRRV